MSELPSYGEMAAEKLKERSKASGGELKNLVAHSTETQTSSADLLGLLIVTSKCYIRP